MSAIDDIERIVRHIERDAYARGWADAMKAIRKAALSLAAEPRIQVTVAEITEAALADGQSLPK